MPLSTTLNAKIPMIRLTGDIDMAVAFALLDEITLLHDYYQFRVIDLHIDSPGGNADALHYLVEALGAWRRGESRTLRTFGLNEVASAAALLLSFGTLGYRTAYSRSRLLYHSVRAVKIIGSSNTVAELRAESKKLELWDKRFMDLLVDHALAPATAPESARTAYRKRLRQVFREDRFITSGQARELRLIDKVI
jgi:ATP-dependent protease ClpP protease subunit